MLKFNIRLVHKIAGTIALFSLCLAVLLYFVLGTAMRNGLQGIGKELIEISSVNLQKNIYNNHINFQTLQKNSASKADFQKFWNDFLENSLTILPPNFQAFIINDKGQVLFPHHLKGKIQPSIFAHILQKPLKVNAHTIETDKGLLTYIVRDLFEDNSYLCIYYVHNNFQDFILKRKHILVYIALIVLGLGLFWAILLGKHLAKPLQCLNQATTALADKDLVNINLTPTLNILPTSQHDEIGSLARSFQYMITELQSNLRHSLSLTAQHERIQSELRLAKNIQESMLVTDFYIPKDLKFVPQMHGLVLPAKEVGGDFFDIFWLDEESFCFAIGDVSDKGVAAAMFMSMTLTLIRLLMRTPLLQNDPAKCLKYVNNTLCHNNDNNMFVTIIVGKVHCPSSLMTYANAGHLPPICVSEKKKLEILPTHKEMVVASFEDIHYTNIEYSIKNGDRIFFYTDGLTEANSINDERFGDEKLHKLLTDIKDLNSQDFNFEILKQIQSFSSQCPQYDDITLLNFLWKIAN